MIPKWITVFPAFAVFLFASTISPLSAADSVEARNAVDLAEAQLKVKAARVKVAVAEVRLAEAKAAIAKEAESYAEAALTEAKERFVRAERLHKSGSLPQEDVSAAKLTLVKFEAERKRSHGDTVMAELAVSIARARVLLAEAELAEAEVHLTAAKRVLESQKKAK